MVKKRRTNCPSVSQEKPAGNHFGQKLRNDWYFTKKLKKN